MQLHITEANQQVNLIITRVKSAWLDYIKDCKTQRFAHDAIPAEFSCNADRTPNSKCDGLCKRRQPCIRL